MKTIMVGIDGSAGGQMAFRTAVDLADLCGGTVYAVAVMPDRGQAEAPADERDASDTEAEEVATRSLSSTFDEALVECEEICRVADVDYVRDVLVGDPARVLTAEAEGADLLVIGAQGQRNNPHFLMGEHTPRILRHSIKPVLVARGEHTPIRRVLVGYDGTSDSGHAVEWAADFGHDADWEIRMVTGTHPESALASGARRAARIFAARRLEVDLHITEGDAPSIIFEHGREFEADLIVIGAAPKGPVTGFFIGEAWPDIVEQAPVSVLCWR